MSVLCLRGNKYILFHILSAEPPAAAQDVGSVQEMQQLGMSKNLRRNRSSQTELKSSKRQRRLRVIENALGVNRQKQDVSVKVSNTFSSSCVGSRS